MDIAPPTAEAPSVFVRLILVTPDDKETETFAVATTPAPIDVVFTAATQV